MKRIKSESKTIEYQSLPKKESKKVEQLSISPFTGFSLFINSILGTGILTLPQSFNNAGIILSTLLLIFISYLSTQLSLYIYELQLFCNAFKKSGSNKIELQKMSQSNQQQFEPQLKLKYSFEYSQIAQQLAGEWGMIAVNFIMIIYLIGSLCVKCITGAQGLAVILSFIIDENAFGLTTFQIAFIIFFMISIYLCCQNISNGAYIQNIICFMRLVTFLCLLSGAIYIIYNYGNQLSHINYFNIQYIPQLYCKLLYNYYYYNVLENVIFALLMHHSIPVMSFIFILFNFFLTFLLIYSSRFFFFILVYQVKPQQSINQVIFYGVNISSVALFFVCFSAMAAFGGYSNECSQGFPCLLNQVYTVNFHKLPIISFICNAYLFFAISSFSINIFTFRNNLKTMPGYRQLIQSYKLFETYEDTLSTCCILLVISLISYIYQNNLSYLINISGGITGLLIMIILPSLFIISARYKAEEQELYLSRNSNFGPYCILTLGIFCFEYTIYQLLF